MEKNTILQIIEDSGIIAVIRLSETQKLEKIIAALSRGGLRALEITMTTPNAQGLINDLSQKFDGEFLLGAGTVLDAKTAEQVIKAGAQFIVSPILDVNIIKKTKELNKVSIPGAFSPTEIFQAWYSGADIVKIFPATALGPRFFKDIHGPLPDIKMTPTGGVSLENAAEFIRAGASCLGVGTALLDKKMIADNDWDGLTENAQKFVNEVKKGRGMIN
jgi:2-dehydro-3-deoxyphosphogluconate aldolase/(4S)-4-hydroxy-2-oxoglutarate aldolase